MRVVGTAGHVDHGKSTLVQALTGTHPDRLKEEREMTIDLGFAFLELADDSVGIVDVPGHRDFIENMLSGVGGIDAALFVVAADEGVMPQTREHLAILDLLQIPAGLVALTKIDMVEDPEWLDLVEEEVRATLANTVLANAPIQRVSAQTCAGVPELLAALESLLAMRPQRPNLGRPRLPIDRSFIMPGFGTVVTGTLMDGVFKLGQEVVIEPAGLHGRIRGLQTHGSSVEQVSPGSRTALNISGLDLTDAERGHWITALDAYRPTQRLDLEFRQLADVSKPIQHDLEVKLFIGAAEVLGRLRLLATDRLAPGETGWIQVELREPVLAVRGDRYILRRPSPGETIGGGAVLDPHPVRRHRRFDPALLERLQALSGGSDEDLVFQAALRAGPSLEMQFISEFDFDPAAARAALQALIDQMKLIAIEGNSDRYIVENGLWHGLIDKAVAAVEAYHQKYPLRQGMPRGELRSRLGLDLRFFDALIEQLNKIAQIGSQGAGIWKAGHEIRFSSDQDANISALKTAYAAAPYSTPSVKDSRTMVADDVFEALVELGQLIMVSPDVAFLANDYDDMVLQVKAAFQAQGKLSVAQIRDLFSTTRKYALAFAEYLDQTGVTERIGDARRLKP